ncbi:MAG: putative transporter [Porphyromonas sp.]|nr:putative transporter [Porphyromonas sp.]
MDFITNLFMGTGIAHSVLLLGLVSTLGIMLGRLRFGKISLGVTMVLFMGILAGHFGMTLHEEVLHFVKEFGLILFVYAVGLQVGPGFFSSFKQGGLKLNLLAVGIVLLGVTATILIHYITQLPMPTMVGILSGAVTNTPGLGAAGQAFTDLGGSAELANSIPLGYAVTYPLGVIGIILAIILIKVLFRVNSKKEEQELKQDDSADSQACSASFSVTNPNIFGHTIAAIMQEFGHGSIVISRHWDRNNNKILVANGQSVLNEGDRIFAIASPEELEKLQTVIGPQVEMDRKQWIPTESNLLSHKYVVSNKSLTGKKLGSLHLRQHYGVNATRINRAGVDFVPNVNTLLQVGDIITVVGSDESLGKVRELLGDSTKHLNEPNLIGIFLGIAVGVFFGSIPFIIPGIPQPVKLGLAGGPLVIAILFSRFGAKFHLVTYTTHSANLMLRELGITLFLACVGIGAGSGFVDAIVNKGGYAWIGYGFIITFLPLMIMGFIGKKFFKVNYFTLSGVMSGAMTDPPALAYANTQTETDAPAVGYATVYPLTMFLRVLTAQMLIIFFCS